MKLTNPLKKIKHYFFRLKRNQSKIKSLSLELVWAHVYHDSIRGIEHIEKLPLNIGRWAGNYAFFYVLNRILIDFKPNRILEFGLGESSKLITSHLSNSLPDSNHLIIEQDNNWKELYINSNKLSNRTKIEIIPIDKKIINGFEVNTYKNLDTIVQGNFDLYIVDGPFGSPRFSRYDIVTLAKKFKPEDEFIILFDDYNRDGEKDTAEQLLETFKIKNMKIYHKNYEGNKSVAVFATKKYQYATTF